MTVSENTSNKPPAYKCYFCDRPGVNNADWNLESLKFILEGFKICKIHKEYCEKRIPELEAIQTKEVAPKKYEPSPAIESWKKKQEILKERPLKPDFQQRASNDGSLIE